MITPKISTLNQRKIEALIGKWSGKLTWDSLVVRIKLDIGLIITRQTLCTYIGINTAYKNKKAQLRGASPSLYTQITTSDVKMVDEIAKLKAEIAVLERNNAEQLRMIERMLTNAAAIPNLDLNDLVRRRTSEIANI